MYAKLYNIHGQRIYYCHCGERAPRLLTHSKNVIFVACINCGHIFKKPRFLVPGLKSTRA